MAVVVSATQVNNNLRAKVRKEARTFFKRSKLLYQDSAPASWAAKTQTERETVQAEINRLVIATLVLLVIRSFPEVAKLDFDES